MRKEDLIVGRWYKGLGSDGTFAAKFVEIKNGCFYHTGEVIHREEYNPNCGKHFRDWIKLELCTQEYLQKCLPKDHPDLLISSEEYLLTVIL